MKIANIPIAVIVNGQRRVIPVGAEIPADLAEHDVRALTASGALLDADAAAQDKAAEAVLRKQAGAEWDAARKAAREAMDSVKPPAAETGTDSATDPNPNPPASAPKHGARPTKK